MSQVGYLPCFAHKLAVLFDQRAFTTVALIKEALLYSLLPVWLGNLHFMVNAIKTRREDRYAAHHLTFFRLISQQIGQMSWPNKVWYCLVSWWLHTSAFFPIWSVGLTGHYWHCVLHYALVTAKSKKRLKHCCCVCRKKCKQDFKVGTFPFFCKHQDAAVARWL